MKRMAQLRQKSTDELRKELQEIHASLMRVRAVGSAQRSELHKGGRVGENTSFIRNLRKKRARIHTILRERELRR